MTVTYSTVIATRNRAQSLEKYLPLHTQQEHLPERIVIVDSSDSAHFQRNTEMIAGLRKLTTCVIDHVQCAPGTSRQRNLGLDRVTSQVTFMPDDDSVILPGAVDAIINVYQRDRLMQIGGVCSREATSLSNIEITGQRSRMDTLRVKSGRLRNRLEESLFPDPMKIAARTLQSGLQPIDWLPDANAVPVEWMTGFRMSFRTNVIKEVKFNENLGRYALYEDVDAGLQAMKRGFLIVAALDAKIFHDRDPGRRDDARTIGAVNILNRAYTALRATPDNGTIRAAIKNHALLRLAQFSFGAKSEFGRERIKGAWAAYRQLPTLLNAHSKALDEAYLSARKNLGI